MFFINHVSSEYHYKQECTFPEENVKWCLQWQNSPPGC